MMDKEVYLVTFDGYRRDGYGSEIYLGGIFDSREKAEKYVESQSSLTTKNSKIIYITLNRAFKVYEFSRYDNISSDIYLGGYAE